MVQQVHHRRADEGAALAEGNSRDNVARNFINIFYDKQYAYIFPYEQGVILLML